MYDNYLTDKDINSNSTGAQKDMPASFSLNLLLRNMNFELIVLTHTRQAQPACHRCELLCNLCI